MYQVEGGWIYSFGELWGTAPCHVCGKEDYLTKLTEEEYRIIEGMDGSLSALTIIGMKIGKPVCGEHTRTIEHKIYNGIELDI